MTTSEPLLQSLELAKFDTPPDAVVKKERELSALLDRVLAAPLDPVRKVLGDLSMRAKDSHDELKRLGADLSDTDDNVVKVGKTAKAVLEKLGSLEDGLHAEFAAVAKGDRLSEAAAASAERSAQLLEAVRAMREEVQETAKASAAQGHLLMILLAVLLAATIGHILFDVLR